MQSVTKVLQGLLFAAGLAFAASAEAKEAPAAYTAARAAAPTPAFFAGGEVMSLEELGSLSGGTGVTAAIITDQTLVAINHGNSVIGDIVTSGDISLGNNAFSGFEGIGNFVVNTGHNNNLQSSMNVSILLGGS